MLPQKIRKGLSSPTARILRFVVSGVSLGALIVRLLWHNPSAPLFIMLVLIVLFRNKQKH